MRFLAMVAVGFPLAFAIAPDEWGRPSRRLGVPDGFAFGLDLTFRFLPSLRADFQTTIDAQRSRGHDWRRPRADLAVPPDDPVVTPI